MVCSPPANPRLTAREDPHCGVWLTSLCVPSGRCSVQLVLQHWRLLVMCVKWSPVQPQLFLFVFFNSFPSFQWFLFPRSTPQGLRHSQSWDSAPGRGSRRSGIVLTRLSWLILNISPLPGHSFLKPASSWHSFYFCIILPAFHGDLDFISDVSW